MKRGVAILGMARSGTGMAANAFVAAGYYAGEPEDLMPADPSNLHGDYENLSVYDANERLLRSLGRYWFAPPTETELAHVEPQLIEDVRRAWAKLLDQAAGTPVVLEDPRIGALLPIWNDMLASLEPVFVVRDPIEIARSVGARDQVPTTCALAAWELHMKLLLRALGGQTVTVMPFRRVLEQPELSAEIVRSVTSRLDLEQQRMIDPALATQAVDASLQKGRRPTDAAHAALTATQTELWAFLEALEPGTQVLPEYPDGDDECALETVQYWADHYSPIDGVNEARRLLHEAQRDLQEARSAAAETADLRSQLARANAITHTSLLRLADAYCAVDRLNARVVEESEAHFETITRLVDETTAHYETTTRLANEMTAHYEATIRLAEATATHSEKTRRTLAQALRPWLARLRR